MNIVVMTLVISVIGVVLLAVAIYAIDKSADRHETDGR
jgi:uncharacterized membrane protein